MFVTGTENGKLKLSNLKSSKNAQLMVKIMIENEWKWMKDEWKWIEDEYWSEQMNNQINEQIKKEFDAGSSIVKATFDNREDLLLASTSNGSLKIWDLYSQQGMYFIV